MILYEYEGKGILSNAGILIPRSQLVSSEKEIITIEAPLVLKAQVLSGKRAAGGGIVTIEPGDDLEGSLKMLFAKTLSGEKVTQILVEEKVEFEKEYYLSLSYDTDYRQPVLALSQEGGTGVEGRGAKLYPINLQSPAVKAQTIVPAELLDKLIGLFMKGDLLLLEINPLVVTKEGRWLALDAKIKLDETAKFRHPDWQFSPRVASGHMPTEREKEAKMIDSQDYRGTAGSAYFDMEGDIAVLSSGGGVSLTAMDALIEAGGKPANFTEYSGNPSREKVMKLTKIVLSKPDLHGLWVIGTVAANFTDIHETLSGLIEGVRNAEKELGVKFDFPIVIRRGGPNEDKAKQMLAEVKDLNLIIQGEEVSIVQSAKVMAEGAEKYAVSQRKS